MFNNKSGFWRANFEKSYGTPSYKEVESIKTSIVKNKPSIVFLFRLSNAKLILQPEITDLIPKENWVLDLDDIESRAKHRHIKINYRRLGKMTTLSGLSDVIKIRLLESKVFKLFGKVLVCSEGDRELLRKSYPKSNFIVVPNVISEVTPLELNSSAKDVLFVGTLSYSPNEDAVLYFCNEVLPLIHRMTNIPINLKVVGFNPSNKVKALANNNVHVTGGVESVLPYYESAKLAIAPILSGGGTRIKILEAMAYQRPVVSTTLGAEGLGVKNGEDILLADNPEEFATAIVTLLESEKYCYELATNGCNLVKEKFTQQSLDCIYANLFQGKGLSS